MSETHKPNDPYHVYRDEAREFKLPEATLRILEDANPVFWKLAIKAKFDPLVFMHLYSQVDVHLKSQAVFDAMVDFLGKRNEVVSREMVVEEERQRLIDSLDPNQMLN